MFMNTLAPPPHPTPPPPTSTNFQEAASQPELNPAHDIAPTLLSRRKNKALFQLFLSLPPEMVEMHKHL